MVSAGWSAAGNVWRRMGRTKTITAGAMETRLDRCLTTTDITLLGIGHMVGAGVYVLTGTVAKDTAGPAIIVSFLIAGGASLLAALCYAEFGARVPKAGSAYIYTYVTIGEFWAFVIGWNIVLEHMIGAASVARAWSGYVDSLFSGAIGNSTIATFGKINNNVFAPYIDPLASAVTLVYCALLCVGVKCSAYVNSVFTIINMLVILFIVSFGLYFADISNWQGPGGFAPYGVTGILAGAATCFYAFVGFDSIATSSEEAKDPARSVPIATLVSMSVVTVCYVMVGATLTLMVPYNEIHATSALPDAFAANHVMWAKYIVSIGALCGMTTSLFGSLFGLPRCIYAMATDGLLFDFLARITEKTKLPVLNMMISGVFTALIALVFDLEKLVEFMSIGTLMAYTIVSASVIILRYQPKDRCNIKCEPSEGSHPSTATPSAITAAATDQDDEKCLGGSLRPWFGWVSLVVGEREAGLVVCWAVVAFSVLSGALCLLIQYGMGDVHANRLLYDEAFQEKALHYPALYARAIGAQEEQTAAWAICLAVFFCVLLITSVGLVAAHVQNKIQLSFKVPLVPWLPLLSIFSNMALMVHLNPMTWVRFGIWMSIGLLVYFCYGIRHSRETKPVSSYTALLSPGGTAMSTTSTTTTSTVAAAFTSTLAQVTNKMAGKLPTLTGKDKAAGGGGGVESAEDAPIMLDAERPAEKEGPLE